MTHNNHNTANIQYFTDRRFGRNDHGNQYNKGNNTHNRYNNNNNGRKPWRGKCYVCGKEGCRSNKHSDHEQRKAKELWRRNREFCGDKGKYNAFLADYEGDSDDDIDDVNEEANHSEDNDEDSTQYVMAAHLSNESFMHLLTAQDTLPSNEASTAQHFVLDRYAETVFQGIMPDTGAAKVSTAGKSQFKALQREMPEIELDTTRANEATICFGSGMPLSSIGTVQVFTPVGTTNFHVVDTPTPFLLCLKDMDTLGIYLNNITNQLICQDGKSIPIFRKWGHPWFFVNKNNKIAAGIHLTEAELCRVHTRFGHPSVNKLHKLLTRAGHDIEHKTIEMINKFCHYCQIKGESPRRFKFTLKKDVDFNYEIIVDVMYLDGKPVLHAVDAATAFQAGRFLKSMSAKDTWEALRQCWIDTYLGPPDIVTYDADTNFDSMEFRAEAKILGIKCHQIPVEAHWSIGKVEKYHAPIRRAYDIIQVANSQSKVTQFTGLRQNADV